MNWHNPNKTQGRHHTAPQKPKANKEETTMTIEKTIQSILAAEFSEFCDFDVALEDTDHYDTFCEVWAYSNTDPAINDLSVTVIGDYGSTEEVAEAITLEIYRKIARIRKAVSETEKQEAALKTANEFIDREIANDGKELANLLGIKNCSHEHSFLFTGTLGGWKVKVQTTPVDEDFKTIRILQITLG
jgi:hypothetical protein